MMVHNDSGNRGISSGPHDRASRFEKAAKTIRDSRLRNSPIDDGGCDCPIVVEGINDVKALRELGFTGQIEKVNRGWPISKLVAYLHERYGIRNEIDGGGSIILLMDWDRTGGTLQKSLRERLESLDVKIDEDLRMAFIRSMKPEGRTVESLRPHIQSLIPLITQYS
tara:strand:+ start:125 stop:625 length:501 start_codon:yes stop_codon:yes gene_type:complete